MNMKKLRTLTMYLPQYHCIPENDKWWGKGFTEWTAVKSADPLFVNHHQPKIPLEGNYYDLMDKQTMQRQAELMKEFGIDGQCIYHYYFKDGKKVLEKPAENLLKWTDIDMPFCFCWANTRWIRTWKSEAWSEKFKQGDDKEQQVLIEQKYGNVDDWEKHFMYLLPFFKDNRYVKVENAPVFAIYSPYNMHCLEEMMCYWKNRAIDNGFRDLYVIVWSDKPYKGVDAILRHSPHSFWDLYRNKEKNNILTFDYDKLWDKIINEPSYFGCKTYFEGMANCDDTPRRGEKGVILNGFNVQTFYEGMVRLYKKSIALGNEFVFINAWNEWGEGMYLEPDEEYGYQVLEALKRAQETIKENEMENAAIFVHNIDDVGTQLFKSERMCIRAEKIYRCFDKWMKNRESGKYIQDYLINKGIKHIAIYGVGVMGEHILSELRNSQVTVEYLMDQRFRADCNNTKLVGVDDELEDVDAIIVTPINEYNIIKDKLQKKTKARIMSLEEIIYDIESV